MSNHSEPYLKSPPLDRLNSGLLNDGLIILIRGKKKNEGFFASYLIDN